MLKTALLLQANIQEREADVKSAADSLRTLESQVRSPRQSCSDCHDTCDASGLYQHYCIAADMHAG